MFVERNHHDYIFPISFEKIDLIFQNHWHVLICDKSLMMIRMLMVVAVMVVVVLIMITIVLSESLKFIYFHLNCFSHYEK